VFRRGYDILVLAEVPGVQRQDLRVEVKGNTLGIAGSKRTARRTKRRACIGASGVAASSTAR
jgi:HSP20 family molecular chaperone IbpA